MLRSEESIHEELNGMLDAERLGHSLRVRQLAVELAHHHKADVKKASLAGLLHDCSRYLSPKDMVKKAEEFGLHIEPIMRFEPKLLHAPLSGYFARMKFGVEDMEVITAIERHTIGSPQMTLLDKVLYIADHVEPERTFHGVDAARASMKADLDETVSIIASCMIKYLLDNEMPIHPLTLETRNHHLRKARKLW